MCGLIWSTDPNNRNSTPMNHALVPAFANPHLLAQCYEPTSRAEHLRSTAHLTENDQDEDTELLKRKLAALLSERWSGLPQTKHVGYDIQAPSSPKKQRTNPQNTNENGSVLFRLVSSTSDPRPICLQQKTAPPIRTREPECEDNASAAEERRRNAQSAAIEFDDKHNSTFGCSQLEHSAVKLKRVMDGNTWTIRQPSIMVTEEIRRCTWSKTSKQRICTSSAPSPHELKPICVPVVPVQTVTENRRHSSGRRRRHQKQMKDRPPATYWKPPSGLRAKCMGYALGYPSSTGSTRDTMKKGICL